MKRTSLSPLFCLYLKAGRIKNACGVSSLTLKRKFLSDKKGHICKTARYTQPWPTCLHVWKQYTILNWVLIWRCIDSDICPNSITFLRFVKTWPSLPGTIHILIGKFPYFIVIWNIIFFWRNPFSFSSWIRKVFKLETLKLAVEQKHVWDINARPTLVWWVLMAWTFSSPWWTKGPCNLVLRQTIFSLEIWQSSK